MALYHVYLLVLFVGVSDEQKESLTASLNKRLTDTDNSLDLLGIWSMHRMQEKLGVTFDLSYYNDKFRSQLQQLDLPESHQLHDVLGSNKKLEDHIEKLSSQHVESSDLQDQLTSDGVFTEIETKLKGQGISATITQEVLKMGHRLDIFVEIKGDTKDINIELDGDHHETAYQAAKDKARDQVLEGAGYHVVRIPNRDLLRAKNKVDFIIDKLKKVSAPEVTPEGGSAHERGPASRGLGKRNRRRSGRGNRR